MSKLKAESLFFSNGFWSENSAASFKIGPKVSLFMRCLPNVRLHPSVYILHFRTNNGFRLGLVLEARAKSCERNDCNCFHT